MKQQNCKKGRRGEDIAERYLIKNGFQIIEKNFNTRFGEVDIIASKNTTLHFVEVKLKVGDIFGAPEEMINNRKIYQVMRTAENYLLKNNKIRVMFPKVQMDAICIVLGEEGEEKRVNYYENLTEML